MCPACGEVGLTPDDIELVVCGTASSTYSFDCPTCGNRVRGHADAELVRLLESGGVMVTLLPIPAEALEPHEGPPLTLDDLLDLHLLLGREDWLERLLGPNLTMDQVLEARRKVLLERARHDSAPHRQPPA